MQVGRGHAGWPAVRATTGCSPGENGDYPYKGQPDPDNPVFRGRGEIGITIYSGLEVLWEPGVDFGILHLVGVLLTVAIGSNYALFFDHFRELGEADSDTLASLLLANLTTVASFALLAVSGIPVLRAIGEVVAPGALLCLVFSAACIAAPGREKAYGKIDRP